MSNIPVVAVVAIPHSEFSNLFLHGRRRDNGRWSIPGGSARPGERPHESARRELKEETSLDIKELEACRNGCFESPDEGKVSVHLFVAKPQPGLNLDPTKDPDGEFSEYKYLDPRVAKDLHIPADRNILVQHMDSINKAEPEYMTQHSYADRVGSGAFGRNMTVVAYDKHGNTVGRAYFINREHGLTMHNFNHHPNHKPDVISKLLSTHAEKESGKKILKPELKQLSPEAKHFKNKYNA